MHSYFGRDNPAPFAPELKRRRHISGTIDAFEATFAWSESSYLRSKQRTKAPTNRQEDMPCNNGLRIIW